MQNAEECVIILSDISLRQVESISCHNIVIKERNLQEILGKKFLQKPELLLACIKNSRQSDVEFTQCLYKAIWEERVDRRNEIRWPRIFLIFNTRGEERREEQES